MSRPLPSRQLPAEVALPDPPLPDEEEATNRRIRTLLPSRREIAVRLLNLQVEVRELRRELAVLRCRVRDGNAVMVGDVEQMGEGGLEERMRAVERRLREVDRRPERT